MIIFNAKRLYLGVIKRGLIAFLTFFQSTFLYKFKSFGSSNRLDKKLFILPGKVSVGSSCYIGRYSYLDGEIVIGDYTMIASNVAIVGGDHVYTRPGVLMRDGGREHWRKTYIGRDVWIGHGAIILNGATIGDGAVVAAGSVVTRDVLPFAIVAGNPARQLRWRFEGEDLFFHKQCLSN